MKAEMSGWSMLSLQREHITGSIVEVLVVIWTLRRWNYTHCFCNNLLFGFGCSDGIVIFNLATKEWKKVSLSGQIQYK